MRRRPASDGAQAQRDRRRPPARAPRCRAGAGSAATRGGHEQRAGQRADAEQRQHHAVGARVPREGPHREQRQSTLKLNANRNTVAISSIGSRSVGRSPRVADALADLSLRPGRAGRAGAGRRPASRSRATTHRQVRDGVDEEHRRRVAHEARMRRPAIDRADHPGAGERRRGQAHRVRQVVRAHHLQVEALPRRHVDRGRRSPERNESAYTIQTLHHARRRPEARGSRRRPRSATCVAIWTRRLSNRSATTPPQAPNSRIGRNCSAVSIPSATPLPVSCRTSHGAATPCIQVPVPESSWPADEQPEVADPQRAERSPGERLPRPARSPVRLALHAIKGTRRHARRACRWRFRLLDSR